MRISKGPSPLQIMIDEKQQESVEYFNYLGSMIINGADVHMKFNPGLQWQKQHSTGKTLFHQQIAIRFKEEIFGA
jgi:hypothetical protein